MNPTNTPQTGDLVTVAALTGPINVYHHTARGGVHAYFFYPGELGLIIETNYDEGGNGAKVMISLSHKTKIGWVNSELIQKIKES